MDEGQWAQFNFSLGFLMGALSGSDIKDHLLEIGVTEEQVEAAKAALIEIYKVVRSS